MPTHLPRPMYVSSHSGLLALLELGTNITSIADVSGWPTRPIHTFAGRHGYLFTRDGVPFQPVYPEGRPRCRSADAGLPLPLPLPVPPPDPALV